MNHDPTTTHRARALAGGIALALLAGTAGLRADDTEVFFGQVDRNADNRPNVLFVLDTSGSMTTEDESGESRIERLRRAMYHILDSSQEVNVGLVRFNGSFGGGSVVEPVAYIDEEICPSAYCEELDTSTRLENTAADVEEKLSNGNVSLDGNVLSMGQDAYGGGAQAVGLAFDAVDVPQGAKIVSATIEFNAYRSDAAPALLAIAAEDVDDASMYTGARRDVSDRRPLTAPVTWIPGPWTTNGVYQSADISGIVEQVVGRAGWCGGNTLNLVVTGSGSRSAKSTRSDPDNAPRLKIRYDATDIPAGGGCVEKVTSATVWDTSDDAFELTTRSDSLEGRIYNYLNLHIPRYNPTQFDLVTALRFDGLNLPAGAAIHDARLTLQPSATMSSGSPEVRVRAHAVDTAPGIGTAFEAITSLPTTTANVDWPLPSTTVDVPVDSVDLSPVVRELVGRPGWRSTSALTLLLEPRSGNERRLFRSRDNGGFPTLTVRYRATVGGTARKVRDELKLAVSNLEPNGGTPIAGALYEATRYLRGEDVDYGRQRGFSGEVWYAPYRYYSKSLPQGDGWSSRYIDQRSRKQNVSHPASWKDGTLSAHCDGLDPHHPDCREEVITGNATYVSPMLESCQSNHVVLLSDGRPTNNGAIGRIEALTGKSCAGDDPDFSCGSELAEWMHTTDFNSRVAGVQGITTYTVGFDLENDALANDYLRDISTKGGGKHFEARTVSDLVATFEQIIGSVTDVDTAFVSPGATVNQFNRLTHRDDIYFALFKPTENVRWPGNLKRYRVVDVDDEIVIRDVNGNDAVDEEAGFFANEAQSFWSDRVDGADVSRGGFAGELALTDPLSGKSRKVLTYTGSTPISSPVDLTAEEHVLHEDNGRVTATMLGTSSRGESESDVAAYREKLLKWARGVDVDDADRDGRTDDVRLAIGDPMHSQPVILNYGDTATDNRTTVFVSTNEGFLHALDPEVGGGGAATSIGAAEVFSWIPKELLGNLDKYYENPVQREHHYGLDGSMSVWIDDKDHDLTVDSDEKAYLFVGMRRGGNSYYALDVSERDAPKLAWVITGGVGGTPGFEKLGQTWSRPIPTRVQKDGELVDVLVFTGGYDTNQDAKTYVNGAPPLRTPDSVGAGLFIVELETGDLVWSGLGAGVSGASENFAGMSYSMPGSAEVVDVNVDGLADQIYASDTGGQVWRFDIQPYHRRNTFIRGGIMARLGSDTELDAQRRFYYEPDVSLIEQDGKRFVSISIGSGWRAHPLNQTIDDRFYVLRSSALYERPAGYGRYDETLGQWVPITDADLVDAEDLTLEADVDGHGWYKELDGVGEKVLAGSLTVNNKVAFTTYLPDGRAALCSPAIGSGAVYVLDIVSGQPVSDMDEDGDVDEEDDKKMLKHPGLPPAVVAIITENNEGALIGSEQTDLDFGLLTRRTHWSDLSGTPDEADLSELVD